LVLPDLGLNPQSTTLDGEHATITPPMRKQYFSYIATVSYFGGRNRKKTPTCDTNKKTAILKDGTTIIAIIRASSIDSFWAQTPPSS